MKRVMILNGPNLNMLGIREPHIYGTTTLDQIKASCEAKGKELGLTIDFHQSNHEGVLIDLIQSAREKADALIINPAGLSFTSVGIMDAIKIFEGPTLEVHISNIYKREAFRHTSLTAPACVAVITGLGLEGYHAAVRFLLKS